MFKITNAIKNNLVSYTEERNIAEKTTKILEKYSYSNKERIKKAIELFHFLVYLDLENIIYDSIIPNEPGDFILVNGKSKIMYEITCCFGNDDTNFKLRKMITNLILKNSEYKKIDIKPENKHMKNVLIKKIKEKENKKYNIKDVKKKILLIITTEYDNCPVTGEWFLKFVEESEIDIKNSFDRIDILDYNACGKDGSPIVIKDYIKTLESYKNTIK